MLNSWEDYFVQLIRGQKKGVVPFLLRIVLHCCSWVVLLFVTLRNWAFDWGIVRQYYPPVSVVVSVGNLTSGGTGKTPVALKLGQEFHDHFQLAILSRGYRSYAEKQSRPVVLSQGQGPIHSAIQCGDEPFLLSKNLPKAFVCVGKNRRAASNLAAQAGAQIILLDDGMQHRRLARDFEVVVVDARDPFGQGFLLPRGFLRERKASLGRADLIVLTHVQDHEQYASVSYEIQKYTTAPIVSACFDVAGMYTLHGQQIQTLQGRKVGMFCGIAQPDNFRRTIEAQGARVVDQYIQPDHIGFTEGELEKFAQRCCNQGAEMLVCTEKDSVKFEKPLNLTLPIVWVQVQLNFVEGHAAWEGFINQVKATVKHCI